MINDSNQNNLRRLTPVRKTPNDEQNPVTSSPPNMPPYAGSFTNLFKDNWQSEGMPTLSDHSDDRPFHLWNKCAAEYIGTLVFVFVGTMNGTVSSSAGLIGAAFAHGLTIFIMVAAFGHISGGHFNPAVSLGVTLSRKMPLIHFPFYVLSQLIGGITGAAICAACSTKDGYTSGIGGATLLDTNYSWYKGFITEIMLTAILVTVILLTAVDTSTNYLAPLAIGLTLTLDIFAGGAATGASMNPARSFGPNVIASGIVDFDSRNSKNLPYSSVDSIWTYHYIYWAGPAIGGCIAAFLYRVFFGRDKNRLI